MAMIIWQVVQLTQRAEGVGGSKEIFCQGLKMFSLPDTVYIFFENIKLEKKVPNGEWGSLTGKILFNHHTGCF